MLSMQKDIKDLWIKALRSGEYQQTTEALRKLEGDNLGYCCLGVLCDLFLKETKIEEQWKEQVGDNDSIIYSLFGDTGFLPSQVLTWAKISNPFDTFLPSPTIPEINRSFISMNDGSDDGISLSFKQIADVIEKYVEGVE